MSRRHMKSEDVDDDSGVDAEEKRSSVSFSQFVDVQPAPCWRVWVGHVPSSLCLHEPGIRQLFEPFGAIQSVTVYHDALSSGSDGYIFLEFTSQSAARAAVDAVTKALEDKDDTYEGMHAKMALTRGKPRFQVDSGIADLLLGRRQTNAATAFSQHSFMEVEDEDELILQSLSQRTTRRSSQAGNTSAEKTKRKRRKSQES